MGRQPQHDKSSLVKLGNPLADGHVVAHLARLLSDRPDLVEGGVWRELVLPPLGHIAASPVDIVQESQNLRHVLRIKFTEEAVFPTRLAHTFDSKRP